MMNKTRWLRLAVPALAVALHATAAFADECFVSGDFDDELSTDDVASCGDIVATAEGFGLGSPQAFAQVNLLRGEFADIDTFDGSSNRIFTCDATDGNEDDGQPDETVGDCSAARITVLHAFLDN